MTLEQEMLGWGEIWTLGFSASAKSPTVSSFYWFQFLTLHQLRHRMKSKISTPQLWNLAKEILVGTCWEQPAFLWLAGVIMVTRCIMSVSHGNRWAAVPTAAMDTVHRVEAKLEDGAGPVVCWGSLRSARLRSSRPAGRGFWRRWYATGGLCVNGCNKQQTQSCEL